MPQLDELQANVRRAVLSGDASRGAGAIDGDGLPPAGRLQIYRNHYLITLTEALAATFPVVARLVGERCFDGLAREFSVLSPPRTPCLFEYGGNFPIYLAAVPTLHALAYLPDVARLEWAINAARHAPDASALPAAALARLPNACFSNLSFTLHPSSRLIASRYPIDRIWRANQPDSDAQEHIGLDQGDVRLLIHRDAEGDAVWRQLSRAEFLFLRALRAACTLGEAWARAHKADAEFDGGRTLAGLIGAGVLIDFDITQPKL
jgi:hypothetical protein